MVVQKVVLDACTLTSIGARLKHASKDVPRAQRDQRIHWPARCCRSSIGVGGVDLADRKRWAAARLLNRCDRRRCQGEIQWLKSCCMSFHSFAAVHSHELTCPLPRTGCHTTHSTRFIAHIRHAQPTLRVVLGALFAMHSHGTNSCCHATHSLKLARHNHARPTCMLVCSLYGHCSHFWGPPSRSLWRSRGFTTTPYPRSISSPTAAVSAPLPKSSHLHGHSSRLLVLPWR
jgi:hypothetical protein